MSKNFKTLLMGIGLTLAAFTAAPPDAKADNDYCREYTRTVYIGGRTQDAYGQACLQSDGSWMIVGEGLGNDIPQDANNVNYVIHDDRRDYTPPRVVYYEREPRYYRTRPSPVFVWSHNNGGYYRGGNYVNYRPYNRGWDRGHDRRDWNDHRGNGRGRGHDRDWH